ncbi:hypothetical protein AVEN_149486-1 [Araneus ventricosus]|uniref:Uncharacterized protein n=1 Tax=Araneus ventricosus TaxID=182803 RepID=A0A4Y2KIC6_ARAVE|nr:hypothetical protein AVEN_149486-1 [Araneus ventricosus]
MSAMAMRTPLHAGQGQRPPPAMVETSQEKLHFVVLLFSRPIVTHFSSLTGHVLHSSQPNPLSSSNCKHLFTKMPSLCIGQRQATNF